MNYLTKKQRNQFTKKHPGAIEFLTQCHVKNELAFLKKRRELSTWEKERIEELKKMVKEGIPEGTKK